MDKNLRGPRLATKLFILMSLALVVIPWFSYLYLSEMEDFLIDSQANAQLLTAEGISTLLNGHPDFIEQLPQSPEGYEQLYAHPLTTPIRIDGKSNDWEGILSYNVSFGVDLIDDTEDSEQRVPNQFYLVLGEHNDQVYALLQVRDDALVFRDRNILRLDLSDHIRITFTGQNGDIKKMVVTMTEPGVTTAYMMDEDWRYAIQGVAENRVQGFMTETPDGYAIEFRMPLDLLGSTKHFGLAVVDVDSPETRAIESITGTLPSAGREAFGLVLLKSPEVLRIVEGLGYSGANIQVIDAQGRVRAEVGSYQTSTVVPVEENLSLPNKWIAWFDKGITWFYAQIDTQLRQTTNPESEDRVLKDALAGKPSYQRRYSPTEGEVIIAAHPIINEDEVIGTVLLKQNTNRIQQLRQDALQRIVNFSVLSLIIFVILIMAFSVRLARRIRKLGAEATNAIDIYGRLQTNRLRAETKAGDEIGDLARSISSMLAKLHQHNQFLENMPRTLRHEINNPLNTLSTSLQHLEAEHTEQDRSKYLESAKRGVIRIGMIVQNLADAANLEDALEAEELEIVDLHKLVESYLNNSRVVHHKHKFEYKGTQKEVLSRVSDYRIEQLLDKLIDNAVDFAPVGSTITVGLTTDQQNLTLFVTNQGPTIPRDIIDNIFDSMVSVRATNPDNRLHFGMGLYVVRVIAEHHGGKVSANNLGNGEGVTIRVVLPRYIPQASHAHAAG